MRIFQRQFLTRLVFLFLLCFLCAVVPVFSGPTGGVVVSGQATIGQQNSLTTEITQTTDRAIINWNQFGTAQNEAIRFVQPNVASIALNRVTGIDPSIL